MAHRAGEVLRADKEPPGVEQNLAFWKAPLLVTRLLLKTPERSAALGLVFRLAVRLWRLVERALRAHVEAPGGPLTGGDTKEPQQPTAFMLMTTCAAVLVLKGGGQRQLAHPLSTIQQPDLLALRVPAPSCTAPQRR
jgi:hypothetical protein